VASRSDSRLDAMNVLWICPEHGPIFIHRGATWASVPDYKKLEPLRDDVEKPLATDPNNCPICHSQWIHEYRQE
jgi:hypothetical protein